MKLCSLLLALCVLPPLHAHAPASTPLSDDAKAIYRDVLAGFVKGGDTPLLHVSQQTYAFAKYPASAKEGCLNELSLAPLTDKKAPTHTLTADLLPAGKAILVDPEKHRTKDPGDAIRDGASVDDAVAQGFENGLFSVSEIVFSTDGKLAAVSYSFHCGSLCGNGSTLIYEKKDGHWAVSKSRRCSQWMS